MSKETIIKAAIKTREGKLYKGRCYSDLMRDLIWDNNFAQDNAHGFITSTGRFVDRREAAQIAHEAGQTDKDMGILQSYHLNPSKAKLELVEECE